MAIILIGAIPEADVADLLRARGGRYRSRHAPTITLPEGTVEAECDGARVFTLPTGERLVVRVGRVRILDHDD